MSTSSNNGAFAASLDAQRWQRSTRHWAVTALLGVGSLVVFWCCLALGETSLTAGEILGVLTGHDVPSAYFAIWELRLPRAIAGALSGAALGMAGYASQTLLRNKLASPDVIGITSGASAAAVFSILVLHWSGMLVTLVALPAGLLTALGIYLLATPGIGKALLSRKNMSTVTAQGGRLILIGIGVAAMLNSVIGYLQLTAKIYDVSASLRWLTGSLSDASWQSIPLMTIVLILCGGTLLWKSQELSLLSHGPEIATSVGVPLSKTTMTIILSVVGLAAAAASSTGPIAFLSFLAGPIALTLVGKSHRSALIPSALVGIILVLGADLVGQFLFPYRLPVGVVTSLIGAPVLLSQLITLNRTGRTA